MLGFFEYLFKREGLGTFGLNQLNQHAIQLQNGEQPLYRLIYSLGPIELKILKTYIKTNLANGFIWPSKLPPSTFILFIEKPDNSLYLYVNY